MFEAMVVSSPAEFAAAVAEHPFADFAFEPEMLARAARTLVDTGLFVVGEPHGVRETPSVLYALASVLGTRALALEWSHEEMDEPVQTFLRSGSFDFEQLWTLPASAEFFCGDGRIAAGQFALLQRLHLERRLDQVIVFDRLDPEPPPDDWQVRDREMAARILAEWDRRRTGGASTCDAGLREWAVLVAGRAARRVCSDARRSDQATSAEGDPRHRP
jgi:hypothetical protein